MSQTITGTLTIGVVLGTGNYGDRLTIGATGLVAPAAAGLDAISAPASTSNASIDNLGTLLGGTGAGAQYSAYAGGAGIYLAGGGAVKNQGFITGGTGGSSSYYGADGGAGVRLKGQAYLTNSGTITGGTGGSGPGTYDSGGNGGAGVDLVAGGTVINAGSIEGGAAGEGNYPSTGGNGIYLGAAGVILNTGTIAGGSGAGSQYPGEGGAGVVLSGGGTLLNSGLITAGMPRADAVHFSESGFLRNTGTIEGGIGSGFGAVFEAAAIVNNAARIEGGAGQAGQGDASPGGEGGTAVLVRGDAIMANSAALQGGAGGTAGTLGIGGAGGIGLVLGSTGRIANTGTIAGGASGLGGVFGTGGNAIQFQGSDQLTNFGTVAGGAGLADSGAPADTGLGGAGIYILQNSSVFNHALITGGTSGYGGYGIRSVSTNSTLINSGTIEGGAGDTGGGIGVYLNGGTLVSAGTIAGGMGADGVRADAVKFGQYAATLDIAPNAVFEGDIAGNSQAGDTIELSGHGSGTLSGLGTTVLGITNVFEDTGAHWTLNGSLSGTGTLDIGAGARLTLNGAVSMSRLVFDASGFATLTLDAPSLVTSKIAGFGAGDTINLQGLAAHSFSFHNDILSLFNAGGALIDTLDFAAGPTRADFHLQITQQGTRITYAGPTSDTLIHLPDWHMPL